MNARPPRTPAARPASAPAFSLHAGPGIAPEETRRLTRLALVLAVLFAGALVFMIAGPHRIGDYMTETDFYGDYARGARLVQQGQLLPARYGVVGPGYEIALALAGFVVRDLFLAARLLSLVAMTAALLLWFFTLRRLADARVGLLAALFLATNGHCFHYGYAATTDALAIALQAGALHFLLARAGPRALLAAGVLSALAFLTRYNAIYLLAAGGIAALAGRTGEPRRVRAALTFAAAFLAPVIPWVLYSLTHGGSLALQLHHNIAYEVFARAKGIPWDTYQKDLQPQFRTLWDVIGRDPGAVFGRMLFNVWDHLRLDARNLLGWPTAAAALAGIALGARDGSLRRLWPVVLAGALLFLTLVPTFYSERYALALLPMYAALAALAFATPAFALAVGRGRWWLKPALAALPLGFALAHSVRIQAAVVDQLPVEVLECAETLRELKRPGDRVIARKWHTAFHAEVEGLPFPFADSLPDLGRYAHASGARWLYFSWPEAQTRPQFYYLLDTTGVVPGLTPRRVTRPHPAVLYEIGPAFGTVPAWLRNDTLVALHSMRARLMVEGDNVALLLPYAQVLRLRNELPAARTAAMRAAGLAPRNVEALATAAAITLDLGDAETALALLRRALSLAPGDPTLRLGLGFAYLRAGRAGEAAAEWHGVIEHANDPELLLDMIRLYQTAGDPEAARRAMARLRQLGDLP